MATSPRDSLPGQIDDDLDLPAFSSPSSSPPHSAFRLLDAPTIIASHAPAEPTPPPSAESARRKKKSRDKTESPASVAPSPPSSSEASRKSNKEDKSKKSIRKKKSAAVAAMELTIAAIEEEQHVPPGAAVAPPTLAPHAEPAQADEPLVPTPALLEGSSAPEPINVAPETVTPAGLPYRRQSMMKAGSASRSNSWRAKNKAAKAVEEEPRDLEVEDDEEVTENELAFVLPELLKDGEEVSGKTVREIWPVNHVKLLYMLSKYAVCALKQKDKETWIRQIPLLVLMYEGITHGVLDFDYAPAAMVIAQEGKPKRIWMNTTQDGKSAIDDLREANLINGLKLSTKDYHSVTAFQVSERGLELIKQTTKELRAEVDSFVYAPKPYRHELLKIRYIPIKDPPEVNDDADIPFDPNVPSWAFHASDKQLGSGPPPSAAEAEPEFNEEGRFVLESIGYYRYSEVTETEDVSYVSSPFVPHCVRSPDAYQQLTSNADRADEAASGQSNIRDELSEAIVLTNPVCLVGEWIPFGSNQIVALNERLGSMDRCQGGLFTSLIDDRPTDTLFEVPPGLTQVRILDYDPVRFINFEAEINFPEDDGIVQIENFGIHLNVDGTIFYGIRVDAIQDKKSDRISVDYLSRLLVDIHQDSSEIMDDLLSSYQTSLLDMVFLGDIANRGKFNMIMADQIEPFMPGLEYMDRGDIENELKQVLGDIHCAYDIGEDSVMIVGRDGMLVAGSAAKRFEKVFISYFSLLCREMFLRSFFTRIFVLEELLKHTRQLIFQAKEDPNHITTIRAQLTRATNDLILFTDTLGYLLESLEFVKIPQKSANAGLEEEEIFSYLDLKKQHHDILLRARDLEKLVHGAKYEVVNLRQMAEVLNTSQLEDIFKTVEANTKLLADSSISVKQSGMSLDVVQVLLAASFALAILDRIPGGTLNIESPQWVIDAFVKPIIDVPFLFFFLNLVWMAACVALLIKYKQSKIAHEEVGRRTLRLKVNRPFKVDKFETYLATRDLVHQESACQAANEVRRVMWHDVKDMSVILGVKNVPGIGAFTKEPQSFKHKLILWWRKTKHQLWLKYGGGAANIVAPRGLALNLDDPDAEIDSASLEATLDQPKLPIQVEVEYDSRHSFLLFVTIYFHLPDEHSLKTTPWWKRLLLWAKKKIQARRRRRYRSSSPSKRTETTAAEQSTRRTLATTTAKRLDASFPSLSVSEMSRPERELLMWFAWTLKNHKVIEKIEHLFGANGGLSNAHTGKNHPNHQATTHAFAAVDAYGRELVDRLREIGLDKHIELPQIAVMGDTSSGKSSLLSALSGVDFPSSDELTTRCPTQLVLSTGTAFRGSVHLHRYATKKNEHHDVLTSIQDVPRAIEKLTQLLVDENQEISDDAIVIELCGPNLPNLTLCDLPGLVRAVQDGQDKSIIPRVREMVNRYMKQSRTVIMAVVPANVDMHNVEILQDAQEADPEGTRTIAVVTKLDLVDAGGEKSVEMLLLNRKKKLTLGYHAVKCRGQKDLNSGMNISTGLKREQEFFLTHEYWGARLARDKWGIEALSTRLVKIMQDNIQRSMPSVIKEIQAKIEEDTTELESMGSSFENAGERCRVFCEWVDRFVRPMQAVLKGDYDTLPTLAMVDSDEVDLRLRAKIRNMDEVFKEKIMATKDQMPGLTSDCELEPDDLVNVEVDGYVGTYRVTEVSAKGDIKCTAFPDEWLGSSRYEPNKLNHLRRFIVQNRGDELAIFPPYSVFCSIFRQWVDTWEEPMLELVRQYYKLTRSVAMRLAKELKAPPPAQEFFQRSVAETLDERRQEAEHELQNLLAMERRPYTQNGELTSVFTQMLRPGLETLLRQRLHVNSAGAVEFGALLEVLTDFSRVSDEHDTVVMDRGLRAYFQLASTRFVDAVPMKLDRVVLQGFVQKMQQQLQTTPDANLERLLCEPESLRARRSELSDSLATLRLAKRQIEDLY